MSLDVELLWAGASLLLLLGAAAGLCVRCSRPGATRAEKIYEQRSLHQNQQSFAVARTYSMVRQVWSRPLAEPASDVAPTRKDKLLQFSPSLDDSAAPRYQNFSKGSRCGSDSAYIDPIAGDFHQWGRFQKTLEDEDDDNSYENVLICKQSHPESGDEESADYQNSASIQQWQESQRLGELVPRAAPQSPAGSPDDDGGDPDYVNGAVAGALGKPRSPKAGAKAGAEELTKLRELFIASQGSLFQNCQRLSHRDTVVAGDAHLAVGPCWEVDSYAWNSQHGARPAEPCP